MMLQNFSIFTGSKMLEQLRLIKWICTYLFALVTLLELLWYPLRLTGLFTDLWEILKFYIIFNIYCILGGKEKKSTSRITCIVFAFLGGGGWGRRVEIWYRFPYFGFDYYDWNGTNNLENATISLLSLSDCKLCVLSKM